MDMAQCAVCGYKVEFPHIDAVKFFNEYHDCERTKLQLAIQRVRELHKPQETMVKPYEVKLICKWCSNDPKYVVYPCPTIKALDGEL